ncbi:MAG: DUF2480 family protein [Putridiphycobacter sp.]
MAEEIVNRVAKANIIQIDLKDYLTKDPIFSFDLKQALWQEIALKEDVFRDFVKNFDWSTYANQQVGIFCSVDAIIPAWAYMVITTELKNVNATIYFGEEQAVKAELFFNNISDLDSDEFKDKRVMVKGCSDIPNPNKAFLEITNKLVPTVKSLMFGEPCSAVPVFKRK